VAVEDDNHADGERLSLVLCPTARDGPVTRKVLENAGLRSRLCADISELCEAIAGEESAGAAVIAEEALVPGDGLTCLMEVLRKQPVWSDLPLVVLTSGPASVRVTEKLVARLGSSWNVTFLERPLRVLTLVSTLRTALRARRHQHQVRELLAHTQEQVRQRDRFLALLGHELRNPLAAIRTAVEVLENVRADDESIASEQRQVIVRQTGNLAHLVDDLLDVARITAGKITLNRRTIDLAELVRQSVSSMRMAMRPLKQQLTLSLPRHPVYVNADAVRIEQVITNLVGNAIKYTQEDGLVAVEVEAPSGLGGPAVIRVRDDGIGMPPETLAHIFEPFYRVDSPEARQRGGLGLGLAVVCGVVELHGGSVRAYSEGPGLGSRFEVRLPVVAAPSEVERGGAPAHKRPAPGEQRSVLVVEDAADARRAMTTLLKLWGHRVESAEDGHDGVRRAVEGRPQIALVDIGLPGIDGYEVARQIRLLMGRDIRLIALTGYGQAEDRKRAMEAGFDRHLVKPVDPRTLAEVLAGNGEASSI
jgi:signal transduction histidine kinase/ActR/RegA family two-component response regulator